MTISINSYTFTASSIKVIIQISGNKIFSHRLYTRSQQIKLKQRERHWEQTTRIPTLFFHFSKRLIFSDTLMAHVTDYISLVSIQNSFYVSPPPFPRPTPFRTRIYVQFLCAKSMRHTILTKKTDMIYTNSLQSVLFKLIFMTYNKMPI